MLLLTFFIGILAILISWKEIKEKVGFFHFNLLIILAGIVGVFLSLDLFLFYFFLGTNAGTYVFFNRYMGVMKTEQPLLISFFFIHKPARLLMFISILALYFVHGHSTGSYTFDYLELLGTEMSAPTAMLFNAWIPGSISCKTSCCTFNITGYLMPIPKPLQLEA